MLETVFTICMVKVSWNFLLHVSTDFHFWVCHTLPKAIASFTLMNMKLQSMTTNHTVQEKKKKYAEEVLSSVNLKQSCILT